MPLPFGDRDAAGGTDLGRREAGRAVRQPLDLTSLLVDRNQQLGVAARTCGMLQGGGQGECLRTRHDVCRVEDDRTHLACANRAKEWRGCRGEVPRHAYHDPLAEQSGGGLRQGGIEDTGVAMRRDGAVVWFCNPPTAAAIAITEINPKNSHG